MYHFFVSYLNANGATDPNSATGDQGAEILIANIKDTRSMLTSLNVNIPVGTSDAGSYFNNKVLAAVDYGVRLSSGLTLSVMIYLALHQMANVHPWFANVSAQTSAAWTSSFFQSVDVAQASALSNNPKMYIAETGWPTVSVL